MFYNRLGWARTHLKKALLINSLGSGQFQITERGIELLGVNPNKITNGTAATTLIETISCNSSKTPRELIHECYQELRNALADDLLQQISSKSPAFFEQLVLDLLVKMGYGGSREDAAQVVGTGDEGIDGIIKEDRLGLDVICRFSGNLINANYSLIVKE